MSEWLQKMMQECQEMYDSLPDWKKGKFEYAEVSNIREPRQPSID